MNSGTTVSQWSLLRIIAILLIAALQVVLLFWGVHWVGKYWSPVLFAIVSLAIPTLYIRDLILRHCINPERIGERALPWQRILFTAGVVIVMLLTYEELRKLMNATGDPARWSDVLPQLETMYHRWRDGIFPYAPVPMPENSPYPVYMPLHWLPVGLADGLGLDSRWIGYLLMVAAAGLSAWGLSNLKMPWWNLASMALVPALGLWGFILWGGIDIPVSFELLIAAYYLVIATGLITRSWVLIAIGVMLCVLSRYTLVFWMPLLAVILWVQWPKRFSFAIWGILAVSVLLIYVVPFLAHDPTILSKGLHYHNGAALAEWRGHGDPPMSYTFQSGIYFAPLLRDLFPGTIENRLFLARVFQAGVMLLLLAFGLWGFFRWRQRMDVFRFALAMLYTVIACFYLFGPLTYRYYWIVPLSLGAVLCMDMMRQVKE